MTDAALTSTYEVIGMAFHSCAATVTEEVEPIDGSHLGDRRHRDRLDDGDQRPVLATPTSVRGRSDHGHSVKHDTINMASIKIDCV